MDIAIVGDGPAADAVESGLADVDANVFPVEPDLLDGFDRAIVIGSTGDDVFIDANRELDRWIAVEIGGIGGHPLADVDAAITAFDRACYQCLHTRVEAGMAEPVETPQGVRSAVRYAGATAARRLIRWLSGENIGDTVLEEPGAQRRLLPVPGCGCAASADENQGDDRQLDLAGLRNAETVEEPSVEDSLSRAERAIDEIIGPITQVGEQESFPIPYYVAATADTTLFSDARAAEYGGGADPDWDRAFMKALGESLERYAAGVYRADWFEETSAATLQESADIEVVHPEEFVTPDSDTGDIADTDRPWVKGTALERTDDVPATDETGTAAWVPAELVFYPPVERELTPAITTGLGLGNSTAAALLSGLYEVIERDATMLSWYSTFEPLGVEFNGELTDLKKRARAESLTATLLLVTQDIDVPVIAAAVHRDSPGERENDWPSFATGSGASLDPVDAARSALAEALQNWTELRAMGSDRAAEQGGAIGRYADFPPAAQEFVEPDVSVAAGTVGEPDLSLDGEFQTVIERLENADLRAYAARTTTRDVAHLGFEAVRVLVPGTQPLFTGEPFFGHRAREVPESMGFEPRLDRDYHPFP